MILLLILIFSLQNSMLYVSASTFDTYYARIMYDEVYLYKAPIEVEDYSNIYFSLPRTYFVELLESSNNQFYKVNYLSFTGYVKKDTVQTIVGKPITPYLENQNFRVYSEQSRDMRSEPSTLSGSSSQIVYIPLYSRNLTYYGTIKGEQLVDGRTNIWYYCKYSADQDYYGYVYSDFCDEFNVNEIPLNTEKVSYTSAPSFDTTDAQENSLPIENKTTAIVIAILTIPAIIFVFMILKSGKLIAKDGRKSNKEIKDY